MTPSLAVRRLSPLTSPLGFSVVHVVAGLSKEHGGTSYSVPSLCDALAAQGASVTLRTLARGMAAASNVSSAHLVVHNVDRAWPLGAVASSGQLLEALEEDARQGSIIHSHGLWLMPNVYAARTKRRARHAKLVHSPRGMLAPAARNISRWKKGIFWQAVQKTALEHSDCLHATSAAEYSEIRESRLTNPVAVIPNAVGLPAQSQLDGSASQDRTVLYLGRLSQKKGLPHLLRAWATVEPRFPTWRLRVIGPAERNHDDELRALAHSLGLRRLSVEPALYGDDKLDAYRTADLFVMPTLNENFGLTVAEALAAETPVICTRGAPWSGLVTERCGWWIDHGVDALAAALSEAMCTPPEELHAMGARGRAWIARDFSWERSAREMLQVYAWLRHGGAPPATVYFHNGPDPT